MKLAVIPARGGSKRIKKKNTRQFAGKPIIAHTILVALGSGLFDRVIVSTDDSDIATVAEAYGADVPFIRPAHLADDHAVIADVVRHAVEWFEQKGQYFAAIGCLYATAPLIQPRYLKQGLEIIEQGQADFSLSVTTFPYPIQRALKCDEQGLLQMAQPEYALTRSQDLPDCFHDAAHFYLGTADAFKGNVQSPRTAGVQVPRYLVQDIDTEEDWQFAELIYQAHQAQQIQKFQENS
ncbi:MAG: pseudaminic acid cytidylyltransferase [Pseudomonadales bacterium]|nr:pseudaminic acid cytidylyltransferase [Pseudomonadales bacterium]